MLNHLRTNCWKLLLIAMSGPRLRRRVEPAGAGSGERCGGSRADDRSRRGRGGAAAKKPLRSRPTSLAFAIDNITLFICAVLVLFMQAGFAMVEAGLNPAKHTVNILCKNLMDLVGRRAAVLLRRLWADVSRL